MDKRTILGFVLIAAVLIGFSWYNQPSKEELAAQAKQDSIASVVKQKQNEMAQAQKQAAELKRQSQIEAAANDTTALFYKNLNGKNQNIPLENKKLALTISTKGAIVSKAVVKGFKDRNGNPDVTLFDGKDQSLKYMLAGKNANIITSDLYFTPSEQTDTTVTLTAEAAPGQTLVIRYTLGKDYMLHMSLQANGMSGFFAPNYRQMDIEWTDRARQQEKGFTFENRYATLTYKEKDSGTDYLSETKEVTDENIDKSLDWVAFKNQFFSAVMISKDDFAANSQMTSVPQEKGSGYLKAYGAKMKTAFDPTGQKPSEFEFYYGPNDFRKLMSVEKESHFGKELDMQRLVYLGWPLFRIINRWFTLYVFDWLTATQHQHGHRAHPHHAPAQGHHLSFGEEELYEQCKDACAEAEARRGHQAIQQA